MTTATETAPAGIDPVMLDLDRLAREHMEARALLDAERDEITDAVRAIKRKHHARLKGLAARVLASRDALTAAIDSARGLFKNPKTRVLHALKLGLRKESDRYLYDKVAVVALIKEKLPEKAALLLNTIETPVHEAIKQLSAEEHAAIGVVIEPGDDVVFIKPVDSSVDKWIEAIVKEVDKEQAE